MDDQSLPRRYVREPQGANDGCQADREERQDLGRSFGCGHRAAVWAFSALAALVHHDLHRRVNCVASVSGGSIANGVLATNDISLGPTTRVSEFPAAALAFPGEPND